MIFSLKYYAVVVIFMFLAGCLLPHKPKMLPPPPIMPVAGAAAASATPATAAAPAAAPSSQPSLQPSVQLPAEPPPPAQAPRTPRTKAAVRPVAPPPSEVTAKNAPAPAPAAQPHLSEIIPPERRADLNKNLNRSLSIARKILANATTRALTADQANEVGLVKMFVDQADAARAWDPTLAAQLARRAELLAESLSASLH